MRPMNGSVNAKKQKRNDQNAKDKGPIQYRPNGEIRGKLEKIAQVNGLSVNDVLNLALPAGLNIVEGKLAELKAA